MPEATNQTWPSLVELFDRIGRAMAEAFAAGLNPAAFDARVRAEQLAAVPGQVECSEPHEWEDGMAWLAVAGIPFRCWKCGAEV